MIHIVQSLPRLASRVAAVLSDTFFPPALQDPVKVFRACRSRRRRSAWANLSCSALRRPVVRTATPPRPFPASGTISTRTPTRVRKDLPYEFEVFSDVPLRLLVSFRVKKCSSQMLQNATMVMKSTLSNWLSPRETKLVWFFCGRIDQLGVMKPDSSVDSGAEAFGSLDEIISEVYANNREELAPCLDGLGAEVMQSASTSSTVDYNPLNALELQGSGTGTCSVLPSFP